MSDALMALELALFVVGVLALVAGRLYFPPRWFVDGIPARLTGFFLILPLVLTFLLLFALALAAHIRDQAFDPVIVAERPLILILESGVTLFGLVAAGALTLSRLRVDTLAQRSFFTAKKLRAQVPLVLFVAGVGLAGYVSGRDLSIWQKVLIWSPLVPAFVYLLRRGSLKLFGPVLFYDLVRSGRRGRFILLRFLYCSLLFFVLGWVFMLWSLEAQYNPGNATKQMARMADSYFYTYVTLQLLITVILTPAYTAGAIAEEKDRHTLEYLLASDLRNREIVLGKLVSRMANLTLMLIAGLPILALMQFLGGVDPGLLLAGFAATLVTMASLATLSIVMSVYARKPRDAIALTYLAAVAYLTLPWLLGVLLNHYASWFVQIPLTLGAAPLRVGDVIEHVNSGNLLKSYFELVASVARSASLADELTGRLETYALFHGIVIVFLAFWAVVRLRAVALAQTYGKPARLPVLTRFLGRPRVGFAPMLWKEIFVEAGPHLGCLGRIVVGVLVVLSFVPAIWIAVDFFWDWYHATGDFAPMAAGGWRRYGSPWQALSEHINIWVRMAGTAVACVTLLGVAVRAAGSVSSERDKQTLDALLTSPLDSDNILFAKWLGSILSVRWAWLWMGLMWLVAVGLGGIVFIAPFLLMLAWLAFAMFVAMVGVCFSTLCRTTVRATVWTLVTVAFLGGGHWLAGWMCCYMPLAIMGVNGRDFEYLLYFQGFALTPPWTMGWLAFRLEDFEHVGSRENPYVFTAFALLGLVGWAIAAAILWAPTSVRFRHLTGRQRFKRPERRPIGQAPRMSPPLDGVARSPLDFPSVHAAEDLPEVLRDDGPPTAR